jgi:hypothetical protein
VITARLIGSDTAIALGITVTAGAPVLELCRKLVAAGHDLASRLDAYRGDVLCLQVRSIGESARLEINGHGTGFKRAGRGGTASPMRETRRALVEGHPDREAAP